MSTKENKEFVRQSIEEFNALRGETSKVRPWYEKLSAPGVIVHDLLSGDMNREERIGSFIKIVYAFPDANFAIDDMVAEGDKVVTRFTMKGTHKGEYRGIPATGKQIVGKGVQIWKVVGGKVVELWDFSDNLGIMTQLGIIPAPKT
jgi:steroid delta-isomerase-like uncharacterized protein